MAPIFPLAKMAFLFVKQVARPLASTIRRNAVRSVYFREKICLPPARFYHWCEVRMKMYVMNIGRSSKTSTIPRLNEEAAIDLGANLLGEGIIFGIALGILGYEVSRQKEKERKKEQEESAFMSSLENRISELAFANQELGSKIQELTSAVYHTQQELHILQMSVGLQPKPSGSVHPGSDTKTHTRSLAECKHKISV